METHNPSILYLRRVLTKRRIIGCAAWTISAARSRPPYADSSEPPAQGSGTYRPTRPISIRSSSTGCALKAHHRGHLATDLATQYAIPTAYTQLDATKLGGLMSY